MPAEHNTLLWENTDFAIRTPVNPHLPLTEGFHLVVMPKKEIAHAWENPKLAAATFKVAADACKIMHELGLAPWFNIQANGNWGLLPGATPFFHIHIYTRNKTEQWAKPLVLPEAPGTHDNQPMPKETQTLLTESFK